MQKNSGMVDFSLVIFSFFFIFIILEIGLRFFNLATDVPFVEGNRELGVKFIPNQMGTFVIGALGNIKADYRINSDGWNAIRDFKKQADAGVTRIAIIGDSYVEAFQVQPEEAIAALLEKSFSHDLPVEVYPFGISGASLSQYLATVHYVQNRFHPDFYIINIVHNDFWEAFTRADRNKHFQSIKWTGKSFEIVKPEFYEPSSIRRLLARSAVVRYLTINLKLETQLKKLVRHLRPNPDVPDDDGQKFEANIKITNDDPKILKAGVTFIFQNYLQAIGGDRNKLLLVMDTPRNAIYEGIHPHSTRAFLFNRIFTEVCQELSLHCLDLTEQFWEDFQKNKRWFNFSIDGHWNKYGHSNAAKAVDKYLRENGIWGLSNP